MGTMVGLVILLVMMLAALATARMFKKKNKDRTDPVLRDKYGTTLLHDLPVWIPRVIAGVFLVAFISVLGASTVSQVSVRSVGVEFFGGKPVGHVGSGYGLVPPWVSVEQLNAANQKTTELVTVRIADSQTAQVPLTVNWQMRKSAADGVVRKYNVGGGDPTSVLKDSLLDPTLKVALNDAYENYNPITAITLRSEGIQVGSPKNPSVSQLARTAKQNLIHALGGTLQINGFQVGNLIFDPTVEQALQAQLIQEGKTEVAKQAVQTAKQQAQKNTIIADSLKKNPQSVVGTCQEILQEAIQAGVNLPFTYGNCLNNGKTSDPAVLVNGSN